MKDILITSTVLIAAIVLLRYIFRSTIPRRVQYALWLLVALRLLVPVSIGNSGWSVAAMAGQLPEREISENILAVVGGDAPDLAPREPDPSLPEAEQQVLYQAYQQEWKDAVERAKIESGGTPITVQSILRIVWFIGMAVMALWFLAANLSFARSLRRTRVPLRGVESRYPVYLCDNIPSPCLFGLFHPAIYVTSAAAKDETRLRYVIAHEETHARHLDPLWSLVRGVCLVIWWFDPLVWLAAYCAKADCELACDEGALARLGESERTSYGETLLSLIPVRRGGDPMLAATTMTAGKRQMKERITRIAEHRRPVAVALVLALALSGVVCAATFTGAKKAETAGRATSGAYANVEDYLAAVHTERSTVKPVRPTAAELNEYGIAYNEASMMELPTYSFDKLFLYLLGADGAYAEAAEDELYRQWNYCTDHDAPSPRLEQAISALSPERAAWIREQIAAIRSLYATPFSGVFGLDGWYEEYQSGPSHNTRRYYASTADGRSIEIGKSFGFGIDDHAVDLDGDGAAELVCNCVYGGDGAARVYVYRRSGDTIERGSIDYGKLNLTAWDNWGVNSTTECYDSVSGTFLVEYSSQASSNMTHTFTREAGLNAFVWEPYASLQQTATILPHYEYQGGDPYLAAVCEWSVKRGEQARYHEAQVTIPCPLIADVDGSDPQDIRVWGNFWSFSYTPRATTLFCVSGGENPGLLHLRPTENGYEVFNEEMVGDGEAYGKDMQRIFGALRLLKLDALDREEVRARFLDDYVSRNALPFTQYQDYGWAPVRIPNAPETPEAAQLVRYAAPSGWSIDYDLREFSVYESGGLELSLGGVGEWKGIGVDIEEHPYTEAATLTAELMERMEQPMRTETTVGAENTPATLLRDGAKRDEVVRDIYVVSLPDGGSICIRVSNTYYNESGDPVVPGADAVLHKMLATFRLTGGSAGSSH